MRFENFKEDVSRWGLRKALFVRLMRRVENYLRFRIFVIHSRTLDANVALDEVPEGAVARLLTEHELLEFARDPQLDLASDSIRTSSARGDICFGYVDQGMLVAYSWYATRATRAEMGLWVRFPDGFSYGYKSFTRPSYRGRHLQECLTHLAERRRIELGARYNIGYIDVLNLSSIKADRRYGNRPVGYAGYARWFGRLRVFHSPGARKCGFEFFAPSPKEAP